MFGVGDPVFEARSEPRFLPDPDSPGRPRLSAAASAAADRVSDRREPLPVVASAPPPAASERPVASQQRSRPFGPVGSLILHLLPLLLLVSWPLRPPPEVPPIPVRLVFHPPPLPPKPQPTPKPKPEVRRPPGRLASEDIGDTKTRGRAAEKTDDAAAKEKPPPPRPSEPEQKTAAIVPPPPMPRATGLPEQKLAREPPLPKQKPQFRPPLLHRTAARFHAPPRPARFPGPAATRDEYLAYLVYLTRRHLDLLPLSAVSGRRGVTVVDILVLDNGSLARIAIGQSSGYPDIDRRVEAMIKAVGRFPPLPQWFQGPSMELEFSLTFPQALEN